MTLWWSGAQLDDFGERVRAVTEAELERRGATTVVGNIVQDNHNINPVVTLETAEGTKSFQIDHSSETLQASDDKLRELVSAHLDRLLGRGVAEGSS
jgi:hypothetical protein